MNVEGKLHIDGTVEGTVLVEGHVSIGRSGQCTGKIRADKVMISGSFDGEIVCNTIDILQYGKVSGEVCSNEFIIEPKGQFVGNSTLNETIQKAELPSPSASVTYTGEQNGVIEKSSERS